MPEFESYTLTIGQELNVSCRVLYGLEKEQKITWKWTFQVDDEEPVELVANENVTIEIDENSTRLAVKNIQLDQRGYYTCRANNIYGSHERTFLIRVKSIFFNSKSNK
jgi:hypothetical protein